MLSSLGFTVVKIFSHTVNVNDCFVENKNKVGKGNGEKKCYISSKKDMNDFFFTNTQKAKCFILKEDLINYLYAVKNEYLNPSQNYRFKKDFYKLWEERFNLVNSINNEIINFEIENQVNITGPRGYINSSDENYNLLRIVALPKISSINIMYVYSSNFGAMYYWKLFVNFSELENNKLSPNQSISSCNSQIINNKITEQESIILSRVGQGAFRNGLLHEFKNSCPITQINDERLLIASHIKPWAVSNNYERLDPKNGLLLSPLYDKLFDCGFISFTNKKELLVSKWLSPANVKLINLQEGKIYIDLPLDKARCNYLDFHRQCVFKG